jgi:hypothetical protein
LKLADVYELVEFPAKRPSLFEVVTPPAAPPARKTRSKKAK